MHFIHPTINISKQLLCFFIGYLSVLIVAVIYKLFKRFIKRIPLRKVKNTTSFILFICNLAITLGGLTVSLYAIGISERIIKVSPSERAQLASSINDYVYLFWIIIGILVACIILWFGQMFEIKKDDIYRPVDMDKLNAGYKKRIEKKRIKIEKRMNKKRDV
jgi:beta-lactamase regulating signal transducer with metallopeptidase domain